jgi:hypothetical protein
MKSFRDVDSIATESVRAIIGDKFITPESRVMLLAIGAQESRFEHTHQVGGPAHGWWQFEKRGAAINVITHPATERLAREVCAARHVNFQLDHVFNAIEHDQIFAACFARLELYTNPKPLPSVGQMVSAWDYYIETWRPGKPHVKTWPQFYWRAVGFVYG